MSDVHITMDLRHLFAKQEEQAEEKDKDTGSEQEQTEEETTEAGGDTQDLSKMPLKAWGDELNKRLEAERKKDPSRAKSEGAVKEQFWIDFFRSRWETKVADNLIQMRLLQRDIEDLGFDPLLNPILAFIIRPFAKKLVRDGLLNEVTFKGLHNAVAHRYLADSELVQENTYNILYCVDLYRQPAKDIEVYLACQKETLPPSASAYNEKTRSRNIQIFLENGATSTSADGAKLRELEEVKDLVEKLTGHKPAGSTEEEREVKQTKLVDLVKDMKDRLQLIAALQYVSMSTNSQYALQALKALNVSNISGADLAKATAILAGKLKNVHFTKENTETFVKAIQARLKEVKD